MSKSFDRDREKFLRKALIHAKEGLESSTARYNPIIAAAQAALESAWGTSQLARDYNNLKGVKAGRSWTGEVVELPTREQRPDGSWYVTVARWRVYKDWTHAFQDYGELIERVYPHAAEVHDDARDFLEALVVKDFPKYATDIDYVTKVWDIVLRYGLFDPLGELNGDNWKVIVYDYAGRILIVQDVKAKDSILSRTMPRTKRVHIRPD